MHDTELGALDFDVIIIGAGISGINAAYRVQHDAPPGTSYAIFEGRDSIGGTWDIWRYPGIRSDSDMFTFGFSWSPWPGKESLAAGEKIRQYMIDSAQHAGIDKHVRYGHKVRSANWNSGDKCWEVTVQQASQGDETRADSDAILPQMFRSRFIFLGTGYYNCDAPLCSPIPGLENFRGKLIRPQHWPQDYDYTEKKIVVIGSGATAISIVPAIAKKTDRPVTWLQRNPSWYLSVGEGYGGWLQAILPKELANLLNRFRYMTQAQVLLFVCRNMPRLAGAILRFFTARLLPEGMDWNKHFQPRYFPWEQRLCVVKNGDLFTALRSEQASIVTDHIDRVKADCIVLKSGLTLSADCIVAATGIQLKFGGGVEFSIDDKQVILADKFAWKQCMLQDVPNLVFSFGYADNSWTLGANCAATVMTRVIWELQRRDLASAKPHLKTAERDRMKRRPLWRLTSTYLKNMTDVFPKGGTGQWRPRGYYFLDFWGAKWGSLTKGLVME